MLIFVYCDCGNLDKDKFGVTFSSPLTPPMLPFYDSGLAPGVPVEVLRGGFFG
ncbi:hypothetical protein BofuT4_uP146500.1 [Botrytis cinerea T4]|uniref:Uncharacterized protein n=1 Tax=Botryotinia fuckeliana (strain T4) TaxID=999810 RepID=G2YXY3_BOTF4|nr:hypothetical protein BofuT4_uP146500.1 [Botrytis cinerea T4]